MEEQMARRITKRAMAATSARAAFVKGTKLFKTDKTLMTQTVS